MTDLIKQIEDRVTKMADDYTSGDSTPDIQLTFTHGAQSMMPLIKKLIEQRDRFASEQIDNYNPRHTDKAWKELEDELLELLEGK